jgi:hypothetical protein
VPPAEPRRRALGHITEQAQSYIRQASDEDYHCLLDVLKAIEAGDPELWAAVPHAQIVGTSHLGRMVALMTNGHVLVWREYLDHPEWYAIFYIGLGNHFV